jgi:hypothetical protein
MLTGSAVLICLLAVGAERRTIFLLFSEAPVIPTGDCRVYEFSIGMFIFGRSISCLPDSPCH